MSGLLSVNEAISALQRNTRLSERDAKNNANIIFQYIQAARLEGARLGWDAAREIEPGDRTNTFYVYDTFEDFAITMEKK